MALVRSRDTGPEMAVRRLVHSLGYRYRLHARDLPGKPDLVFRRLNAVIFVHGCFWHRHDDPDCRLSRMPKSRLDFWLKKLVGNRERDIRAQAALLALGYRILVVWECEVGDADGLARQVREFLG